MHDFLPNGYPNSNRGNLELFVTVRSLILIEPVSPRIESRITDHYATENPFVRCLLRLVKIKTSCTESVLLLKLNICREGYMTKVNKFFWWLQNFFPIKIVSLQE